MADRGAYEFDSAPAPLSSNNKRRSVARIFPLPNGSIDAADRMHVTPLYRINDIVLWAGKLIGIVSSSISKVNGVAMNTIKKILGV